MNSHFTFKILLTIFLLGTSCGLRAQDSLHMGWLSQAPEVPGTPIPINQDQFEWTSNLKLPLPGAPNQGWMLVSVRTDAEGAFMGHCFAAETDSQVDQWFLEGLRGTLIQDSTGNPLEGWTAIQFGYCLPCGKTRLQALMHTHLSQSQPVNSNISPGPKDFNPGLQQIQPVGYQNFLKTIPYPSYLKEAGVEGKVYLQVRVDHFGRHMEHKVLRSSHPGLSEAVVSQIENLRFLPAIYRDGRGKGWIILPFPFRLP